jgi:hypothetical protein
MSPEALAWSNAMFSFPLHPNVSAGDLNVLDRFQKNPAGYKSSTGWCILSAFRKSSTGSQNVFASTALAYLLTAQGYAFDRTVGVYEGEDPEPGYLIICDKAKAIFLGHGLGQESVLTSDGLVYTDNSGRDPVPFDHGHTDLLGAAAEREPFYTHFPTTGVSWSAHLLF